MVPCDESSLEKAVAPAAKTREAARFHAEIGNSGSGSKNAVGRSRSPHHYARSRRRKEQHAKPQQML